MTALALPTLAGVLADRAIHTHFQPIVDLDSGATVAVEALSRGPAGPFAFPDALFGTARIEGRLAELDALCRETAVRTAAQLGLAAPRALFVNIEPEVVDAAQLAGLVELAERGAGFDVVLEITERAIAARPAELLATVRRLRAAGWRIALDDVGADDMSLTFMPLLQPDIVKLDLRLVQQRPDGELARVMHAVNGYAATTGALVLAEGIEDEAHLAVARSLGATLGQGWLFGRPQPVLPKQPAAGALPLRRPRAESPGATPFECLPPGTVLRTSTKRLLVEFSKLFEREALRLGSTAMVLAAFERAEHFTPITARRYAELADRVGFVAALGEGLPIAPVPGVRGAVLAADDPARHQWDVVVLDAHFAGALIARDLGDDGPDAERRFEFVLTYDRSVVTAAALSLMDRVAAASGSASSAPKATSAAPKRAASAPKSGCTRRTRRPGAAIV